MSFKSCDFLNNLAEIGGGFVLLTREHYQSTHNTLSFIHCNWWNNYARYSAAMDLSRTERSSYTRDALTPQFINCSFIDNHVLNSETKIKDSSANFTDLGKGTLMTLYFTIVFQVHVSFEKNIGSALYLISSNATFSSGITAVFNKNHGINGGAFCLKASSVIKINPNSTFNIHNNTASSVGGAIFYSGIGEHQLHDKTHTCIFDAIINVKDIQINFSGNRHYSNKVNSVYASPLYDCVQTCISDTFITREMLLLCNSGPIGFCQYNTSNVKPLYRLPKTVSVEYMDTFMCGSSRSGVLCGECRKGYSAYYHSPTLECKEDKLCEFGWLFYIMSELFPLTTFFAVIILFNVKITSSAANGFIFYCQVVSALVISSYRKEKYLPNQILHSISWYLLISMPFFWSCLQW